jgi:transposase-like protein
MQDMTESAMIPELRTVLKRLHYPLEVMLVCARWYAAYPLSFRHLEEMMQERGVFVDHSTVHRWALKILPVMALIWFCRVKDVVTKGNAVVGNLIRKPSCRTELLRTWVDH